MIIKLFLIDRSVIWVHGTYHSSLTREEFVHSITRTNLDILIALGIV